MPEMRTCLTAALTSEKPAPPPPTGSVQQTHTNSQISNVFMNRKGGHQVLLIIQREEKKVFFVCLKIKYITR